MLQAPLAIAEMYIQRWGKEHKVHLQPWVARIVTIFVLEVCAYFFFFAPVELDSDIAHRVVEACNQNYQVVLSLLTQTVG